MAAHIMNFTFHPDLLNEPENTRIKGFSLSTNQVAELPSDVTPLEPYNSELYSRTRDALLIHSLEDEIANLKCELLKVREENEYLHQEVQSLRGDRFVVKKRRARKGSGKSDLILDSNLNQQLTSDANINSVPPKVKNISDAPSVSIPGPDKMVKKIRLLASSQGRNVSQIINNRIPNVKATGTVIPGGVMSQITEDFKHSNEDVIIVMGGGNDVAAGHSENVIVSMKNFLDIHTVKNPEIFVLGVLHRHHIVPANCVDLLVNETNRFLKALCDTYSNVTFIDTSNLLRSHFTSHGLHLNYKGKVAIVELLKTAILNLKSKNLVCIPPQTVVED